MQITTRLTHNFIELKVDENETTIFKSDQIEVLKMIEDLSGVIEDLERYITEQGE